MIDPGQNYVPYSEMEAVIVFLMNTDFKKHVNILDFMNLKGFELTEEEIMTNYSAQHVMKVIKIMLH